MVCRSDVRLSKIQRESEVLEGQEQVLSFSQKYSSYGRWVTFSSKGIIIWV